MFPPANPAPYNQRPQRRKLHRKDIMAHTIRMTDYAGDLDSLHAVNLAGPYPSSDERDAEMCRLGEIIAADPENRGLYQFEASELSIEGADTSASATQLAAAQNADDIVAAFH